MFNSQEWGAVRDVGWSEISIPYKIDDLKRFKNERITVILACIILYRLTVFRRITLKALKVSDTTNLKEFR